MHIRGLLEQVKPSEYLGLDYSDTMFEEAGNQTS